MISRLHLAKGQRATVPKNKKALERKFDKTFEANIETIRDAYRSTYEEEGIEMTDIRLRKEFENQMRGYLNRGYDYKEAVQKVGNQNRYFESIEDRFKDRYYDELMKSLRPGDSMYEDIRKLNAGRFFSIKYSDFEYVEEKEKKITYKAKLGDAEIEFIREKSPDENTGSYWSFKVIR